MFSEISKVIKDTVVSIISETDVKEALCTLEAGQTAQNRVQNLWWSSSVLLLSLLSLAHQVNILIKG